MAKSNYKTISVFNVCISGCLDAGNMSQCNGGALSLCEHFYWRTLATKYVQVSVKVLPCSVHCIHICHP